MSDSSQATVHRLDALPIDRPMPGVDRKRIVGRNAMITELTLEAGVTVPAHRHANEQFVVVLKGRIRFELGDPNGPDARQVEVNAGEVLHLPPNVPHSATALDDVHVIDVFSPPSEKTGLDGGSAG